MVGGGRGVVKEVQKMSDEESSSTSVSLKPGSYIARANIRSPLRVSAVDVVDAGTLFVVEGVSSARAEGFAVLAPLAKVSVGRQCGDIFDWRGDRVVREMVGHLGIN